MLRGTCPDCHDLIESSAERHARLIVRLRQLSHSLHHALNHPGEEWSVCQLEPCKDSREMIAGRSVTGCIVAA
jgi:hypothetical protein